MSLRAGMEKDNNLSAHHFSWSSFGITDKGKMRKHNEDAMLNKPEIGLWAVADGMGGHQAGDMASQMVVNSLNKICQRMPLDQYIDNIEDNLAKINKRLVEKAKEFKNQTMIGSTVVGMIAYQIFCAFFWVGDSRLYRMRNGTLRQLSVDHSQVETYIQKGLLNREEAATHPNSNIITRAVGASDNLYIDFDIQEMQKADRYMLCSDGLTKHLHDLEFENMLAQGNAKDVCNKLIQLTLERGAGDNVTVIVIDIE